MEQGLRGIVPRMKLTAWFRMVPLDEALTEGRTVGLGSKSLPQAEANISPIQCWSQGCFRRSGVP